MDLDRNLEQLIGSEHTINGIDELRFLHTALVEYVGEDFGLTRHIEVSLHQNRPVVHLEARDAFLARAILHEEGRLNGDVAA